MKQKSCNHHNNLFKQNRFDITFCLPFVWNTLHICLHVNSQKWVIFSWNWVLILMLIHSIDYSRIHWNQHQQHGPVQCVLLSTKLTWIDALSVMLPTRYETFTCSCEINIFTRLRHRKQEKQMTIQDGIVQFAHFQMIILPEFVVLVVVRSNTREIYGHA